MNIELIFLESFPSLDELAKNVELYIQIKNERFHLLNLIKINKKILLNNIKKPINLVLLNKENNILGKNVFDPIKYKELFLIKEKSIFQWIDFKIDKNKFKTYFLFEIIRIKIKITPILIDNQINQNLTYDEHIKKNLIIDNKNININQSAKIKLENSFNKSNPITSRNKMIKNKIFKLKNNKISINSYSNNTENKNIYNNSETKEILFNESNKNNSFLSKKNYNCSSGTKENYNKILNLSKENPKYNINKSLFKDDSKENDKENSKKNQISLFGEQLLLNDKDEILINNQKCSKEKNISLKKNNKKNGVNANKKKMTSKNKIKINNIQNIQKYNNFNYNKYLNKYNEVNNKSKDNLIKMKNLNYSCFNQKEIDYDNEEKYNEIANDNSQYDILKNDFDLFYNKKLIKSFKNEDINFEFNLFIRKSILLLKSYNINIQILFFENKFINNFLKTYLKKIKILKKKINKLSICNDTLEIKLENLKYKNESNFKFIEALTNQNNFQKEILVNFISIYQDKEISLKSIIQKLINSKIKNNNHLKKIKLNEKINIGNETSRTYDYYNNRKFNLISEENVNNKAINKNKFDKKKSFNLTKLRKILNNEGKYKELNETILNKINNNNNNNCNRMMKSKIFKNKKKSKTIQNSPKLSSKISKKNIIKTNKK